jgi:hypothetical protein
MPARRLAYEPTILDWPVGRARASRLMALAAAMAGALAPWLLVVGAHGGLARSATACLAGPLPL